MRTQITNNKPSINQYTYNTDNIKTQKPLLVDIQSNPKKLVINPPKELLFKASDGKTYDFKNIVNSKLSKLEDEIRQDIDSSYNFMTKVKNFFGISNKYQKLEAKIFDCYDVVTNATSIETLFEELTGKAYSAENLDRFLKNKISLKISSEFTKITSKEEPLGEIAPCMNEKYYINQGKEQNIKLNKTEQNFYDNIIRNLDNNYKQKLTTLLKQGKLTQRNNKDEAMILDSLNKIITTPRQNGIDGINVLKECIDILENPSIITQNAEDIPEEKIEQYVEQILRENREVMEEEWKKEQTLFADCVNHSPKEQPTIAEIKEFITSRLKNRQVGTCAAASIEYDFATKNTADFFKMVEAFTSQKPQISKTIKIGDSLEDFLTKMETFKTEFRIIDNNSAKIVLKPDKEAIKLAKIQNDYKDPYERSIIDILMQSAIMNLGSGGTYNSVTDTKEKNIFNKNNSGLTEQEIRFVKETLLETPVFNEVYQIPDGKHFKFIKSKESIKNDISEALNNKENIVIGYLFGEEIGTCGHEITIIGQTKNINGEKYYICQDSDDDKSAPVTMSEKKLLSCIHHASFSDKDSLKFKRHREEMIKNIQQSMQYSVVTQLQMNQILVLGDNTIPQWSQPQIPVSPNSIGQNPFIQVKVPLKPIEQNLLIPAGVPTRPVEKNAFMLMPASIPMINNN